MSEINDQLSDTSSDLNWPIDHPMEGQLHDRIVFENVADQYVKGEDVTAFFTILQDIKGNPDEHQIGLFRVGCTNIKECLAYAAVQFNPSTTSGSTCYGTATFPSSSLPETEEEFYQFCYIIKKTKNLGSSMPFQLNCALDDIDLLSNTPVRKIKADDLIALVDRDNDDIVVIHTKRTLIEEKLRHEDQQLLNMKHQLESQNNTLTTSRQTTIDELSSRQQSESKLCTEDGVYRSLCRQYQAECLQYAERCRLVEDAHAKTLNEANRMRSQLAVTSQLTKDQATHIVVLERRLMQANELSKTANQRQTSLERELRDLHLTSEKYQISMQGQLDAYSKRETQRQTSLERELRDLHLTSEKYQISMRGQLGAYSKRETQREDHINAMETMNSLLKEELNSLKADNELAHNQIELLQIELNEKNPNQQPYMALKTSYTEIEKRCVKHQKSEIDAKRQLNIHQTAINGLQREIQYLTERLSASAEEYNTLLHKHNELERKMDINHEQEKADTKNQFVGNENAFVSLRNTYENEQEKKTDPGIESTSTRSSISDVEVHQCPMCFCQFPQHFTLDAKNEHIENHFH